MHTISIRTSARTDFINITSRIQACVSESGMQDGVVTVFVPHTTAGITINENADPDVVTDMKAVLDRVIPWADGYRHAEGNTAAHVKASMMGASVHIIVQQGRLALGTWQGVFFCEFDGPRQRQVWMQVLSQA